MNTVPFDLPDGTSIEVPRTATFEEAEAIGRKVRPDAYKASMPKPQEGFFANLKAGAKSSLADAALGIGSFGDEKAAREAHRASQKELDNTKQVSWDDVEKAKGVGDTLTAFGGYARDSVARSLPYMGAVGAGALAGTALGPVGTIGGAVAGGLGAFAVNAPMMYGSNLARQDKENPDLSLDKTAAAAAAAPQALLDSASTLFLFGKFLPKGVFGTAIEKLAHKPAEVVEKKLVETAQRSMLKAGAIGAGEGALTEMPTELAQQILERYQAGLPLTGDDANKEYKETLIGAGVIGGALGPYHGVKGRNDAQATLKERAKKAADAARADAFQKDEAEKEKQAAFKKTPEYLKQLDEQYTGYVTNLQGLMEQRKALGKPLAGTSEAAQAVTLGDQIKKLRADNKELAAEHAKNQSAITHSKIDAQDLWASGVIADPAVNAGTPDMKGLRAKIEEKRKAEAEAQSAGALASQYVNTQAEAARNYVNGLPGKPITDTETYSDINDYVEHIVADPAQAAAALKAGVAIPGATKQQNKAIWGLVKMQLAEKEAQAKKAAEEQTRIQAQNDALAQSESDLATQATNATQEVDPLATFKESLPEPVKEEEDRVTLDNQLTAWGLRPDGTMQPGYLDGVLEKALGEGNKTTRSVALPEGVRPVHNAPSLFAHLDDLYAQRDAADKALDVAVASRNKDSQTEAAQNRERVATTLSRLVDSSPIIGGVVAARKAQDTALGDAAMLLEDLNANRVLGSKNPDARGSASSTPETLLNQVAAPRQAFVQAVIREAAVTRAAFGKALSEREALQTAANIQRVFNEWMTRAAALPRSAVEEDRLVSPAQMRGTEIVKGAEYEKVDPRPLRERKLAAFGPASEVLQEQIRKEVGKLTSVPDQSFRSEQPLKTQFASTEAAKVTEARGETAKTRGGELRRRREYVTNLIDKALQTRGMLPAVKSALERAAQAIESGKGSTDVVSDIENNRFSAGLLDSAEELARRVLDGTAKKTNTDRLLAEINSALKDTTPAEGQGSLFDATPQIEAQAAAKERIQALESQVAELRAAKHKTLKDGVAAAKRITDLEKAIALLQGDKKERLDTAARDAKKEQARLEGDVAFTRATAANFAKAPEVVAGRKAAVQVNAIKAAWQKMETAAKKANDDVRKRLDEINARLTDFDWLKGWSKKDTPVVDEGRQTELAALRREKMGLLHPTDERIMTERGQQVPVASASFENRPLTATEAAQLKIKGQLRTIRAAYEQAIEKALTNAKESAFTPALRAQYEETQEALKGAYAWLKEAKEALDKAMAEAVESGEKSALTWQRINFEKGTPAFLATHNRLVARMREQTDAAKAHRNELQSRIVLEMERIDRLGAELADIQEKVNEGWSFSQANLDAATDGAVRVEKLNLDYYANQLREQGFVVDTETGTVTHPRQVSSSSQEAELRRRKEALAQAETKKSDYAAEAVKLRTQQEGLGLGGTRNTVSTDRYGRRTVKTERIEPITERDERLRAEREARKEQDAEEISQRQAAFKAEREQHQKTVDKLTKEADDKQAEINAATTKREKKPLEKSLALTLESLSAAKLALSNVGKSRVYRQQALTTEARPIPTTMRTGSPESKATTLNARAKAGKPKSDKEQSALDRALAAQEKRDAEPVDYADDGDISGFGTSPDVYFRTSNKLDSDLNGVTIEQSMEVEGKKVIRRRDAGKTLAQLDARKSKIEAMIQCLQGSA